MIIAYCIVGYLFLFLFSYTVSERIIFQPPHGTYRDTPAVIKITTKSGRAISALYLKNPKATYTLLVSHGNAEDLGTLMYWLQALYGHGFSVMAYDYQGYGTSEGTASEAHTYQDITATYEYLYETLQVPSDRIIAYGRSLGAAVAIDLATRKRVAALILEGTFVTAFRVMTVIPVFPFDRYDNLSKVKKIHVPVLMMHGMRDGIVPFWHGKKIYQALPGPKQHYWVEKAGHNDLFSVAGEGYWRALKAFIKTLS